MRDNEWPNGGAVRNDQDEAIVQGAVEDAEARQVLVDGIETCRIEGDMPSFQHFTALLAEADRRIRVREEIANARARTTNCDPHSQTDRTGTVASHDGSVVHMEA